MLQQADELIVLRHLEPFAPDARFLEVGLAEGLAGVRLDAPARVVERAHLVGQQWFVIGRIVHTDTNSLALRAASPWRCTFRSATTVGRKPSSQLDYKYRLFCAPVSVS